MSAFEQLQSSVQSPLAKGINAKYKNGQFSSSVEKCMSISFI